MILQIIRRLNPVKLGLSAKPNFLSLCEVQHSRSITSKQFRDTSIKKPAPWPYEEKKYTFWHALFINTKPYFDENSRVIVVDGNVASGKTELAKALADELGMKYFPECNVESLYIDDYGFDYRTMDPYIPEPLRSCDMNTFYKDPHHKGVPGMQMRMYGLRLEQYMDALAHLFNTGDGIILERSVYSDFVFIEAMFKMGYLSKNVRWFYNEVKYATITELIKPHLVIYLDVPVDVLQKRIKAKKDPIVANSKVLSAEYLSALEHHYKTQYLKDISQYSEVLVYDWSEYGDPEAVVEDIERIDFNKYDKFDVKLKEWRDETRWYWNNLRRRYTNEKSEILEFMNLPHFHIHELCTKYEDILEAERVFAEVPSVTYAKGFNPLMGEKGYLFKMKENYRHVQKYRVFNY